MGGTKLDLVIAVVDGEDGAPEERAVRFGSGVGCHCESIHARVLAHHFRGAGEHGGAAGGDTVDLGDGTVFCIDPQRSIEHVGGLALRCDVECEAFVAIHVLGGPGFEVHLIVGGGEPGLFHVSGLVDVFFVVEKRSQDKLLQQRGTGLRKDGVAFADVLAVQSFHGHFSG